MPKTVSDGVNKRHTRSSLHGLLLAVPKAIAHVVEKRRTRSRTAVATSAASSTRTSPTAPPISATAAFATNPTETPATPFSRGAPPSTAPPSKRPATRALTTATAPPASAVPRPHPTRGSRALSGASQLVVTATVKQHSARRSKPKQGSVKVQPPPTQATKSGADARKINLKDAGVPKAAVAKLPSVGGQSNAHRSEESQAQRSAKSSEYTAHRWLRTVPIFRFPNIVVKDLLEGGKNTKAGKAAANAQIGKMKNWAADAGSLVVVDKNGDVLFAYFAHAFEDHSTIGPQWATLSQFLDGDIDLKDLPRYPGPEGRTLDDVTESMKYDGLQKDNLARYHLVSQNLSSVLPPISNARDRRHDDEIVMSYPIPGTLEEEEEHRQAEAHREGVEECPQKYERAGVTHLVHAWIQQGHVNGLLYPSRDMMRTSLGHLGVCNYYLETEATTKEVNDRFKASFPEYFEKYRQAFEAGVTNTLDPGPFLGRALVWKMQVKAHQDGLDEGPAATFPCGYYSGGYLYIPQLGMKLSYRPGDLAIFLAGHLYHAVDQWTPRPIPAGAGVSPGRVSSVFFFPKHSFSKLKGKPRLWNMKTLTGTLFK